MTAPLETFAPRVLAWFDCAGRHDLPWQHPRTPYRVWLSEVMLQQTQVKTAIPYFEKFLLAFPDLPSLAAATLDDVLAQWSGLGYYARAKHLHEAAKVCVEEHGGDLPRDFDALHALPGIGRSTAGAILAQAWGDAYPILDGNVKRVLARYHGVPGYPGTPAVEQQLWALAKAQLPESRMADYTQAQMDFGATLCTKANPACVLCVLQDDCVARREGRVAELPTAKPGKALPERTAVILYVTNAAGAILLQRRAPQGIWASLWSLPETADEKEAQAWFEHELFGNYTDAEILDPVPHAFSHYKLQLQPRRWTNMVMRHVLRETGDLRWVHPTELATLGMPAPIRKLLQG